MLGFSGNFGNSGLPGDEMRRKHGRSGGIGKCNLNFVE